MLHTVIPIEDVLATAAPSPVYGEVVMGGRRLVVSFTAEGSARLERLISTNPLDYLHPRLQPGANLEWVLPPPQAGRFYPPGSESIGFMTLEGGLAVDASGGGLSRFGSGPH